MDKQKSNVLTQDSGNSVPEPDNINTPSIITLDDVEAGYGTFLRKRWWQLSLIVIAFVVVTAFLTYSSINPLYGIIIFIFGMAYLKQTYEHNLFKAFANTYHYVYQKDGRLNNPAGIIFSIGHDKDYSDMVSGTYQTWPFALFMYSYDTGQGRYTTAHQRAIMAVNFGFSLPTFVLRRHKLFQILEEDSSAIKNEGYTEKVSLEGSFDKHFEVYIHPNSQVEVLSILTPDVMETLIGLDKYEIEMAENGDFYVYCHGYITKKQSLIDIYKIIEAITPKIGRYATRQKALRQYGSYTVTPTIESV